MSKDGTEARVEALRLVDVSESLQAAEESEAKAPCIGVAAAEARGLRGLSKLRLYADEVTTSEAIAMEAVVVTSEILESTSGFSTRDSSISGAEDLLMIDGRLPVVVEVAEVATAVASEAKEEVMSNMSWLMLEDVSTRVADLDLTLLEEAVEATDELAAKPAASQAGQGRLVLLNNELVSELELLLSLVPVELPNLDLLKRITLSTSTLSDSKRESWLRFSRGSSSRPTGVTLEGLPNVGGS